MFLGVVWKASWGFYSLQLWGSAEVCSVLEIPQKHWQKLFVMEETNISLQGEVTALIQTVILGKENQEK